MARISTNIRPRWLLLAANLLCAGGVASASSIIYNVIADTSSITGIAGSLDFNFNPGPLVTQFASLQILNFASDGTLASCAGNEQGFCSTGDVSGQLPGTLTFDNGTSFDDFFNNFTFGTTISFDVSLYGPALNAPDGVSTSGSTFAFSIFSDSAGTIPALTSDTDEGFAFTIDVNLDGSTTLNNFSAQTSVTPGPGQAGGNTPEPGSLLLVAIGLGYMGFQFALRRGPMRVLSRLSPTRSGRATPFPSYRWDAPVRDMPSRT